MGLIWTIVGVLVSLFVSVGISVLGYTPPEFRLARACFWASAILLGLTDIAWHVQTNWTLFQQLLVAGSVWVGILIGLPIGLRWIEQREKVYVSLFPARGGTITSRFSMGLVRRLETYQLLNLAAEGE